MKISVVIPVYNVEDYIEECLQSVLRQTHADLEVILVDDCGMDASMAKAEALLRAYDGSAAVRILRHSVNRGLSASRNTGMKAAAGDAVFFLDSDDYLAPQCLELLSESMNRNRADMTLGGVELVGKSVEFPWKDITFGEVLKGEQIFRSYLQRKWYVMAWNKLVRKDFLLGNRLFFLEGETHEDEAWSFDLALCARTISAVYETTLYYRIREGSITQQQRPGRHCRSMSHVLGHIHRAARAKGLTQDRELRIWFSSYMHNLIERIMNSRESIFSRIGCFAHCMSCLRDAYRDMPFPHSGKYQQWTYRSVFLRPAFLGYALARLAVAVDQHKARRSRN